jgi:hypothetical protein
MDKPRDPLKWENDITFKDDATNLALQVKRAKGDDKTLFSFEIGRIVPDGRFIRFFGPRIESKDFVVRALLHDFSALPRLLGDVTAHIEQVLQAELEDKIEAKRITDLARGKPKSQIQK